MPGLKTETIEVRGATTRIMRNGASGAPLVFLHGGVPGVTPYCSGMHVWGGALDRFAAERSVVALDLPGSGGTDLSGEITLDLLSRHVRATLEALGIARCHVIGHDLGGLLAFGLAVDAPALVSAVTAVASVAAAPTGDGVENLSLAYPPSPRWTRVSQAWAFERVSYSHRHIDDALLAACVDAADGRPHQEALRRMAAGENGESFVPSLMKAKSRFYEVCRSDGVPVPCQVVWGSHDPLGSVDQGLWLFRGIAKRQRAAQFHVINRAGALPFREEPESFHQVVSAFADVVFP